MTTKQPIGLVVAMEAELVHLLRVSSLTETIEHSPWRFQRLDIAGREVVAVRSGMGLVNAAAGTERLIAEFQPRVLLNYGCTGAHLPEIMPGDIVIGEGVVHHSAMQILADGTERHTGFGFDVGGEKMDAAELASAPELVAAAAAIAGDFSAEPWPVDAFWPQAVPRRAPVIHHGVVASADIWTQSTARLDILHERHGSLCEDMEAAAIAQICARHGVPYLTVKDISNNEYLRASDLDGFSDFPLPEIGKRAAAFVAALIATI